MRSRQRGITILGWLFLLVPIGLVGYAGIRLTPIYLNYMKIVSALDRTAALLKADESLSAQSIKVSLNKEWDVQSLDFPKVNDLEISKAEGRWTVEANYEDVAPLFGGISILVKFDKTVAIGS